ncbi:MAG: hypothetical protein PHD88_04620 [Firmicutes bacterium]|nr:hypothetical protein [Bacillota bacterium]MDD4693676.1 hypothetical protein [Bacillota bacterium]
MKKGLLLFLVLALGAVAFAAPTNLALNKEYVFNIDASPSYPDNGSKLTDGVYASALNYADRNYLAHLREDFRIVIIDLEGVYKLDKVLANFLNQQDVGAARPDMLSLAVSEDGRRWKVLDYAEIFEDELPIEGTYVHQFELDASGSKARFVAVKISVRVWAFMDEIEVLGDLESKEESTAKADIWDIDFEEIEFDF